MRNNFDEIETKIMEEDIKKCTNGHLIIRNNMSDFDFSLLPLNPSIKKITLSRAFKYLELIPSLSKNKECFKNINEIVVPRSVCYIDFLEKDDYRNSYSWPHLTLEKRNKTYFQYEHGIYKIEDMFLLYVEDDYNGNFTIFRNTRNFSRNVFLNKKLTGLTISENITLNRLFHDNWFGYSKDEVYFTTCKNIKTVDIQNTDDVINKKWFTKSVFNKIVVKLAPKNLSIDDRKENILDIVKILSTKECVQKQLWIKYFRDNLKTFYKNIVNNQDFLDFVINEKILKPSHVIELIRVAKDESGLQAQNTIKVLNEYKEKNISEADVQKYEDRKLKEQQKLEEYKKKWDLINKEREKQAAIRRDWQCHRENGDIISIAGYKGNDKDIVVPEKLDNKLVTIVCSYAFSPNADNINDKQKKVRKNITSITLPDTLEFIDGYAFEGCVNLSKITLPSSLKLGGQYYITAPIFDGCVKLKEIEVPEGVTKLFFRAFEGNQYLEKITLPSSLKEMEVNTFARCVKLQEINIPEGIELIDSGTFAWCSSLRSIIIPRSVKEIYGSAFTCCKNLETIVFLNPNTIIADELYSQTNNFVRFIAQNNGNVEKYAKAHNVAFSSDVDSYIKNEQNKD